MGETKDMNGEELTRSELIFHLTKGHAHMSLADAVEKFPEDKINVVFTNGDYTFWHLLEHIRRTQQDILDFIKNSNYKERKWPKDYWPPKDKHANKQEWAETIEKYKQDQEQLKKLIEDKKTDIYAKIPHGTDQTFIRELMVIIDHNAYHIGEFAIMRQVLSAWNK